MKKVLMVQSPQWCPTTPHLAIPLLSAQLKAAGFETDIIDLNIKFYNEILTEKNLQKAYCAAKEDLERLEIVHQNTDFDEIKKIGNYTQKTSALKYLTLKKFFKQYEKEIPSLISAAEHAVRVMKDPALFYDPESLHAAKHTIHLALRLASMPYAPNEIDLHNYFLNPAVNLDWENIEKQVDDKSVNMFYDFLKSYVNRFAEASYDIICVSLTDVSQLVAVFTLMKLLKAHTNATVVLGGNYATQISQNIIQYPQIFGQYFDYLSIGNGETALPILCKALDHQCEIETVPNLIYYSEKYNKIMDTGFSCAPFRMDALAFPDYTGYDFDDYFTPEILFPIELSKGCYWGKCTFCDYAYGQQEYSPKAIERIIRELKYFAERFGATKFVFVDECIPPAFYNALADAIIEAGLKIHYYSFARLEKGYTKEVLQNLYKSGARLLLWGYEAQSERVMKLMNKGIDIKNRLQILRDSRGAGIWNNGLFIFGYPTETMEEMQMTMDFVNAHRWEIPSCSFTDFKLKKHSILSEEVGKNGVYSLESNGDFFSIYKDKIEGMEPMERREFRRKFQFDYLEKNAHSLWAVISADFEHLLLYLAKYGCDYVSAYRSEKRIAPEFR